MTCLEDDDLASAGADHFVSGDPSPELRGYVPSGAPVRGSVVSLPDIESLPPEYLAACVDVQLRRIRDLLAGIEAMR